MSASRKAGPLRKFSRGERRNAARALAKDRAQRLRDQRHADFEPYFVSAA